MYLEWITFSIETSLLIKLGYLTVIFVGITLKAFIFAFFNGEDAETIKFSALFLLAIFIWLILFRLFLISIILGTGILIWNVISMKTKQNSAIAVGFSFLLIIFGALGVIKII